MSAAISNVRPKADKVLVDIVDYVMKDKISSREAYDTARLCLLDTLGCGLEALEYPACTKLLGPVVPGTVVPNGAKVPGTQFQLDPIQAAFNIGAMIRGQPENFKFKRAIGCGAGKGDFNRKSDEDCLKQAAAATSFKVKGRAAHARALWLKSLRNSNCC